MLIFLQLLSFVSGRSEMDAFRTFEQVCKAHGYLFESHKVSTDDGYILTLFRIPGKRGENVGQIKPVVFLQHGLIDLADTWIMNDDAPGFLMADAGFDVWLGNSRGSFHSLEHHWLDYNKDSEYWEFTWQHMADFDLPAMLGYVLKKTQQQKLSYIAHSQGTLQMFARLSTHPEFSENLNVFIALGPVGTVKNIEVPMLRALKEFPIFELLSKFNVHEFLPNMRLNFLFYEVCKVFGKACDAIIEFYADMQVEEVDNVERFPVILAHETGGTSVLNMKHWQQMMNYEEYKVQRFDFGVKNKEVYGQDYPPLFDFTKIPGPIALFYGTCDRLADLKDVYWLEEQLGDSVVYSEKLFFGHASFMWGRNMTYFDTVISLVNKYN